MKEKFLTKNAAMYVAVGVLYFILALPFSSLNFPDGYTELRFTGLLPMAAGLLFGFPGALACALGNLGGDLCSGLDIYSLFGFVGNFLMAWLPYKLWHTLFIEHRNLLRYLDSPGSVLKFVVISLISGCASAGVIAAGGQLLHGFSFGNFFVTVALQYYDFSILGGMLLFHICVSVFHIVPRIPQGVYGYSRKKGAYMPDYLLSILIVILSIAIAALTLWIQGADLLSEEAIGALCFFFLIGCSILALLPIKRGRMKRIRADGNAASEAVTEQPSYVAVTGLRAQCIIVFMVMLCGFLSFSSFTTFRLLYLDYLLYNPGGGELSVIWARVIFSVALAATSLVIVLFLILRLISRRVVEPMERMAEYTRKFAEGGELQTEPLPIERTENELDDLAKSVNVMTENIRSYVYDIRLRTIKEEKMAAELSVARSIQQSLLPEPWSGGGFDLEAYIQPAKEVSGDFYHFVRLDDNRVFLCIADVSGKDISAAMFMVKAKTLIESICDRSPEEMLIYVNGELAKRNEAMMFVTVFAAVADRKKKKLFYASAGHNPPVCRNGGQLLWLDGEADFVLGPLAETKYRLHTMDIKEDFTLFIYTDGVTEAESLTKGFFGEERLLEHMERTLKRERGCREIIDSTVQVLEKFTEGAQQSDDITMLALTLKQEGEGT